MIHCLVPGKETRENTKAIVDKIKDEIIECKDSELSIDLNDRLVTIDSHIKISQIDGKIIITISGCGGAFCTICCCNREEANDPGAIQRGFEMDRTNADMISIYDFFGDELMSVKSDDRVGVTYEPMITGDEFTVFENIPILHTWINTLRFFEDLPFFLNARHAFPDGIPVRGAGLHKSDEQHYALKMAKLEFIEKAKNGPLNLTLCTPNSTGAGGSTDTGIF